MIHFLDRLNLRPQERRLVVGGIFVVFIVLNVYFVWPHYGQLERVRRLRGTTETTLKRYREEVGQTNEYNRALLELERAGTGVLDEAKDLVLLSTIQAQAQLSGVNAASMGKSSTQATRGRTNEFFEQTALTFRLQPTFPEPLIHFLASIATNDLIIRVKELDLKPTTPDRTRLTGNLKFVASFRKKSLTRTTPAPAPAATNPKPKTKT